MILFVGDTHLGRTDPATERAIEASLIEFLESFEDKVTGLVLTGDIFDQYIEHNEMVPKGFVRFQALLARWTDAGTPIWYVVGNHDPWHRDYFQKELGVTVEMDQLNLDLLGRKVVVRHGDGLDTVSRTYNRIKPILRNRFMVSVYRLLPADTGYNLARWYNRKFGREEILDERITQLRSHAERILKTEQADLVVMGHSHRSEKTNLQQGVYLNPGCWYIDQTFGCMDDQTIELRTWNRPARQGVHSSDPGEAN